MLSNLFKTFFKIGMFTLGGGYAMIPIIESEVVDKNHWVSKEEFLDLIAIAQSCPGVFAINISIFIGYRLKKTKRKIKLEYLWRGDAMAYDVSCNQIVWVAAKTSDCLNLARSAKLTWTTCWIPIAGALAIWALGVSPILIILLAGFGGWVYGALIKPTE